MCISAAMLKEVSNLKIVHTSITKSSHVKGLLWKRETQDLGDLIPVLCPAKQETGGLLLSTSGDGCQ